MEVMGSGFVFALLVGVALVYVKIQRLRGAEAKLVRLLNNTGLERGAAEISAPPGALSGTWGGRAVNAWLLRPQMAVEAVRLEITVRDALPGVSARMLFGRQPARDPEERALGDGAFDARVAVRSAGVDGLARLSAPVRAALRHVLEQGWTLREGTLTLSASWSGSGRLPVEGWRQVVLNLLAAVDAAPTELAGRLNAEPDPELRLGLLMALSTFGPEFVRKKLPRTVIQDPDPLVRCLAAAMLGDGAAWDASPAWAQERARGAAPAQVVALHQRRRDEGALLQIVRSGGPPEVLLALQALGAVGSREVVPHLKPLVTGGVLGGPQSAAKRAVEQIQARLVGAERGQVALIAAASEAGDLSLAEGGDLALVRPGELALVRREGADG